LYPAPTEVSSEFDDDIEPSEVSDEQATNDEQRPETVSTGTSFRYSADHHVRPKGGRGDNDQ
jgi:hypothetical protein